MVQFLQYRQSSPVIQYYRKEKEYPSAKDTAEVLDISSGTIRDNCCGRYKLTAGYQFKYKDSNKEIKEVVFETRKERKQAPRKCKHVIQYDLAGNIIKEYDSAKEAAKAVKVNVSKIYMVCSGKRNLFAGFKWKYKKSE